MYVLSALTVTSTLLFSKFASSTVDFTSELSKLALSPNARIHLRDQPRYADLVKRWSYWEAPDFAAVVEAATANDVSKVIQFANTHDVPYFAITGGHGGISPLGSLKNGIQINMRPLNSIALSPDGTYMTVGGGVKGVEVRDTLWELNKWTPHGVCECPGFAALALGGGHGLLQGRYGLMSDQVLSMDVVLANGTAITASETSHPELFWGLQGAGHNFGIVTSLDYKVYDVPDTEVGGKTWSYELLIYAATPENIKSVFGAARDMMGDESQPDGMTLWTLMGLDPASGKPAIIHHVIYNAPLAHLRPFTEPFHALSPIATDSAEGNFLDVPRWMSMDAKSVACETPSFIPRPGYLRVPVDVKKHNLDALVEVVDVLMTLAMSDSKFVGSIALIEQYPMQAVKAKGTKDNAVPWREHELLLSPVLLWPTDETNKTLEETAYKTAEKVRGILVNGAKDMGGHYSYVNYAYGGESSEEVYGAKNLVRLRKLKDEYDPENRFKWNANILEKAGDGGKTYKDEL